MKHLTHRRAPGLLPALLLVLCLPSLAYAQAESGRGVSFGIGGGVSVPVRSAKDAFKNGFNGQAMIRLDLGSLPLALRGEFAYQSFDLRAEALAGTGGTHGTGTLLGGLGSAQVYLFPGHVRPYLLAGVGAYSVKIEHDAVATPSHSDTRLGVSGGAGLEFAFGSLSLYAEGRFDHVFAKSGAARTDALQIVPLSCGVLF